LVRLIGRRREGCFTYRAGSLDTAEVLGPSFETRTVVASYTPPERFTVEEGLTDFNVTGFGLPLILPIPEEEHGVIKGGMISFE
jgi:hypothetical protein